MLTPTGCIAVMCLQPIAAAIWVLFWHIICARALIGELLRGPALLQPMARAIPQNAKTPTETLHRGADSLSLPQGRVSAT